MCQPSLIIDAGANIGMSAIYFANRFPAASIYAIEPDAVNFDLLTKNAAQYPNIHCLRGALWPTEAGYVKIANPESVNPAAYRVEISPGASAEGVQAYTPLSLLRLAKKDRIDIFKIDIEGAELELFEQGSSQWLPQTGMILAELHDRIRPGTAQAFFRAISPLRFLYFQRGETSIIQLL